MLMSGGIITPAATGSIASSTPITDPVPYERPADWLALPEVNEGDEKIVGLYAVYNTDSNFVAFRCSGAYTVDWGDGSAPENFASNTTAEHVYDSDDYAALGAGTDCSRGYRQAIITVTPQAGQSLTSVSLDYRHSTLGSLAKRSQWLDIRMAGSSISSLAVGGTTGANAMLEQFEFVGAHGVTDMSRMFQYCYSLQSVSLFDTSGVESMAYMFSYCYSLQSVPLFVTPLVSDMSYMFYYCYSLQSVPLFDTSGVKNMAHMFDYCYSLQSVPLFDTSDVTNMSYMFAYCSSLQSVPLFDTSGVKNMSYMFYYCYSLQSVPLFDTSDVTNMVSMFYYCSSLQSVPPFDTSSVTNMSSMFVSCYSLQSVPLQGTKISYNIYNCSLSRDELVAVFNGLANLGGGSATINVRGNWGVANLIAADLAIATDKGWKVTT
jgi:surface protein